MQTTASEATTAPIPAEGTTSGGTTVVLEPSQLQQLVAHNDANTYAIMLGIGFVILLLSGLVIAEILTGRGGR